MSGTSFIFFDHDHGDCRFCLLDDPAMEIKALDPLFRIRRGVHLGNADKTGYGYQVFVDNRLQRIKLLSYLKIRGHKGFLIVGDGYAHRFSLETMRDINCTYDKAFYIKDRKQTDRRAGYSIHIEDSSMLKRIPISYDFICRTLERHPELMRIRNMNGELKTSLNEYKAQVADHLKRLLKYSDEQIDDAFEKYRVYIPIYHLENYSPATVATIIDNEF